MKHPLLLIWGSSVLIVVINHLVIGRLCLWGEKHVVFQTRFRAQGALGRSMWHLKSIRTPESTPIAINFRANMDTHSLKPMMVTMNGHLLVIGHDPDLDQVSMMSFAPEEAMSKTPNGQRIDLRLKTYDTHGLRIFCV